MIFLVEKKNRFCMVKKYLQQEALKTSSLHENIIMHSRLARIFNSSPMILCGHPFIITFTPLVQTNILAISLNKAIKNKSYIALVTF